MPKILFLLPILLSLLMCDTDEESGECLTLICEASFSELYIQVIDSNTGQNVLLSGTYQIEDISIDGGASLKFEVQNILEKELLVVYDENWNVGNFEFLLQIGETNAFQLNLDLARTGGSGCCSNQLFLDNLKINNTSREINLRPLIFTIMVD